MTLFMRKFVFAPPSVRFTGAVLALVLLLAGSGCSKESEPHQLPPPSVVVVPVAVKDVPVFDQWVGTLEGYTNAKIRAQVEGVLRNQAYQDGSHVKEGDLMFEIDPRPFQAVLEQAKGQLAEAEARLGKARLDADRYKPLAATGAISQQELDNALQALAGAEAGVVSSQAAVEAAKINLDFTRIQSSIDGLASISLAQVGDLVGPGSGVMASVSTIHPIKAYFYISEQDYLAAARMAGERRKQGEKSIPDLGLELILADGSTYPERGKLTAVDNQIDVRTGSIQMVGTFPNPDNLLRPGQFARIRGQVGERKDAILVPQRAVSELQGAFQVAVVESDNTVKMVTIKTGERVGADWVILDGLKPGDRVVVEGLQKVRSGSKVNPVTPEQAKATEKK